MVGCVVAPPSDSYSYLRSSLLAAGSKLGLQKPNYRPVATLASGDSDSLVKLWDAGTGQELGTLEGWKVVFSPDGKLIASGGAHSIKLWDVGSRRELRMLGGGKFADLAFSPDGKLLASGSGDGAIKVWGVNSGSLLRTLAGHKSRATAVAFSPDGRLIAGGNCEGSVKLWDARSGRELRTLEGHDRWGMSIAFSPEGRRLAIAGGGRERVEFWGLDLPSSFEEAECLTGLTLDGYDAIPLSEARERELLKRCPLR